MVQSDLSKASCSILLQAGEILRRYFRSGSKIFSKGSLDITTEADKKVDIFLRQQLTQVFPYASFLTEETVEKGVVQKDYTAFRQSQDLIVIDSLDGTNNFARKNPDWGISVARVVNGEPQLGIIYLPMSYQLLVASSTAETVLLNGKPIRVSKTDRLRRATLNCDWVYVPGNRLRVIDWLGKLYDRIGTIKSMGSAVKDLCRLAWGEIDIFLNSGLKPWDVAAAAFIVQKAGGRISTPDGEPWDIFNPDILATNDKLHQKIVKLLR